MRFIFTTMLLCSLSFLVDAQQILDLSGTWSVIAGQERSVIMLPNTLDGANIGRKISFSLNCRSLSCLDSHESIDI